MNNFFRLGLLVFSALFAAGCFRNDLRTAEFHVPKLNGPECLSYLSGKLRAADGVMDIQGDFEDKKVTVQFNGLKLGIKNIEIYIADAGFDVNERPGAEAAKPAIPASCR